MAQKKSELSHLRIFTGGSTILLFLTTQEVADLETQIISGAERWINVTDRIGHVFKINTDLVGGLEIIGASKKTEVQKKNSIPIKKLADFAGVHPLTITRNFADTLNQSQGVRRKHSRATKATALALYEHLLKSEHYSKNVPDKEALLALFGKDRQK